MDFEAMMRQMGMGDGGGLPMPSSFPSPEEVDAKARKFSKQLFTDYGTLRMIVERHEDTIRKRWSKKSNIQKKKILLEAWPNMPAQHRPDVQAWKRKSRAKEPFLWPSINLEDLMKTRNMLIFLHARGRHQPHEFVHADMEQTKFGEWKGVTMPAFLNEYTMYFHGRTDPNKYGELVSWDDDDDAFENMTNGVGMHPGDGLHALEIQQRILSFLVKWCELLLRDLPSLTEGDVLPDPGPPTDVLKEAGITSLEVTAMEAQYTVPSRLDFTRLKGMLAAERNAREDHILALREDPSYFADTIQDYADHRQEVIVDTKGHKHPTLKEIGQPLFWNRVLGNVIVESHFGFATFDEISKQIQALELLHAKYKDGLKPEKDLPSDLMEAFQDVRFTLRATVTDLVGGIKMGIMPSPPMRRFCYREPQVPNTTKMRAGFDPSKATHAAKEVMALFNHLFNEHELSQMTLHALTDELDRLMRNDAEASALISPFIASRMSSLSVVAECLHQLHLFQPWARKIEDDLEQNKDRARKHYQQTFSDWSAILAADFEGTRVWEYADPTEGKFDYPVHRRRNKENVEKLRSAEANLDAFWEAVDRHYQAVTKGKTHRDLIAHMLSSDREIQRTAPWKESERTRPEASDFVYQPFSSIFHDRTNKITSDFDRTSISTKSTKTKTRGPAGPVAINEDAQLPTIPHTTDAAHREKKFTVDKRAHKVFKALFHSPNNPDLPGEIPWLDLLHAMVSMGFLAEKANGSAWNFFPRKIDVGVERSIQFHEPHPEKKIPFRVARRFGRRLGRAYGWGAEMFALC